MPKQATNITISKACQDYWQAAKEVVDEAGTYAGRVKLRNNLLDSSTAWKVQDVLVKYYNGRISSLDNEIQRAHDDFIAKVEKLNVLCLGNNIETIKYPEKLLYFLLPAANRKSFNGKIMTRLKNGVICPLQDFVRKKK
ncbi:hypothetical protein IKF85_02665 [Candidatus Saccharibacteria bacterium]|nr:hypothetical protein [Candidatus Saccharibacteria bacterium]